MTLESRPEAASPSPASRWRARIPRAALAALAVYALLAAAVDAVDRVRLWDMRTLDTNLVDFTWQIELAFRATRGEWSGRDFFFPMGPVWQVAGALGELGHPFSAGYAIAAMQVVAQLVGLGTALFLGRRVENPWLRWCVVASVTVLSYGAGIATFRSVLSALHLFVFTADLEAGRAPRWKSAFVAAGIASVLMLLSFERLLLAGLGVAAMCGYELVGRRLAREPLRPAVERALRYFAAQLGCLAGLAALGALAGANPYRYFVEQRAMAASYSVNLAREAEGNEARLVAVFALAAGLVAVAALAGRRRISLDGAWISGALPMTVFAVVQPNRGHVFMGVLPLVIVLIVVGARESIAPRGRRVAAALLGCVFVFGWFGKYRDEIWLGPKVWQTAWQVHSGEKRPQTEFQTDVGHALAFAREIRAREHPSCMGFSPALTAVHAFAEIPGPTMTRLRWSAEQRHALGLDLESARCPYFVYQIGSFDRVDRPNWFIGEDLVAIGELYEAFRRLGPATVALRLRPEPARARVTPLETPVRERELRLGLGEERVIPIAGELGGRDLLRIEYTLRSSRIGAALGATPKLEYRFEQAGKALSDFVPFSELAVNRRGSAYFAVNPAAAEQAFIGIAGQRAGAADALRVRLVPRSRFGPKSVELVVHALAAVAPSAPPSLASRAGCDADLDLEREVLEGRALLRNVAPRPADRRFLLHPTPDEEQPAEAFFDVKPCANTCLSLDAGLDTPKGSGDGVPFEIHVLDLPARPKILDHTVEPGERFHVEVPLGRWLERDVLIRLGSHNGPNRDNDFLYVEDARVARCSARVTLADAFSESRVVVANGTFERAADALVATSPNAEVDYRFHVIPRTCMSAAVVLDGDGTSRATFRFSLLVDHLDQELWSGSASADEPRRVLEHLSFHDWFARDVELHVKLSRTGPGRVRLEGLHLESCPGP